MDRRYGLGTILGVLVVGLVLGTIGTTAYRQMQTWNAMIAGINQHEVDLQRLYQRLGERRPSGLPVPTNQSPPGPE